MDMVSARLACETIGCQLHSTDHFIAEAVEWLGRRTTVTIYFDEDSWIVRGASFVAGDETLADALSGAVHASASAEEMAAWDKASDEALENEEEEKRC